MKDNSFKTVIVDDGKHYMVIPDCPIRLVFEDNEYVGWYYAGDDAVEMLKNEEIRENPRKSEWIPVSERFPKSGTFAIVHTKNGVIGEGILVEEGCWYWPGCEECTEEIEVTHWMPLPEPPKEGE
jgi:hypothetical protein